MVAWWLHTETCSGQTGRSPSTSSGEYMSALFEIDYRMDDSTQVALEGDILKGRTGEYCAVMAAASSFTWPPYPCTVWSARDWKVACWVTQVHCRQSMETTCSYLPAGRRGVRGHFLRMDNSQRKSPADDFCMPGCVERDSTVYMGLHNNCPNRED